MITVKFQSKTDAMNRLVSDLVIRLQHVGGLTVTLEMDLSSNRVAPQLK